MISPKQAKKYAPYAKVFMVILFVVSAGFLVKGLVSEDYFKYYLMSMLFLLFAGFCMRLWGHMKNILLEKEEANVEKKL